MTRGATTLLAAALAIGCHGDDGPSDDTNAQGSSTGGCDVFVVGSCPGAETTLDPTTADDGVDVTSDGAGDESTTTTGALPVECADSRECAPEFCVAPFNPNLGVFGRGPFACVEQCVELQDELKWCADAAACCDPEATCTDRGYCELEGTPSTGADDTGGLDGTGGTAG